MPLHSLDSIKLREACRSRIEGLEIWLRRIIDEELRSKYGLNYINHIHEDGSSLIKKGIRDRLNSRYNNNNPRHIDAALFENLADIVSNPVLFENFFKEFFAGMFPCDVPHAYIYLKHFLHRLQIIRNSLSHAGTISIRDVEFTLWITSELAESFKGLYKKKGKEMEYDVPQIIRITDSFGNVIIRKNFSVFEQYDFSTNPRFYLRPGDILSIEIEVDPSYTSADVLYRFGGTSSTYTKANKEVHAITEHDVCPKKVIHCQVKSTKNWHKYPGRGDDQVDLYYKVLPPLE